MKLRLRFVFQALATICLVSGGSASADVFVAVNDGSQTVGGTTSTIEGSSFVLAGSSDNWTNAAGEDGVDIVGTDLVGRFGGSQGTSDWYFQVTGNAINSLNLAVDDNRFVEVFYSLDRAAVVAPASDIDDNRFFLSDSSQGNNGQNPQNGTLVPSTAGSHSFVLDLLSTDGTALDGDFGGAGVTWDQFRWDPWNNADNRVANEGLTFTLDRIVFGSTIVPVTAIPEPGSLALLGMMGAGLVLRRKKRTV